MAKKRFVAGKEDIIPVLQAAAQIDAKLFWEHRKLLQAEIITTTKQKQPSSV